MISRCPRQFDDVDPIARWDSQSASAHALAEHSSNALLVEHAPLRPNCCELYCVAVSEGQLDDERAASAFAAITNSIGEVILAAKKAVTTQRLTREPGGCEQEYVGQATSPGPVGRDHRGECGGEATTTSGHLADEHRTATRGDPQAGGRRSTG